MSNYSDKQSITLYKEGFDFDKKSNIATYDLTDQEYKHAFMNQHKFSLKSKYYTTFTCDKFCNLTISIEPQIIENQKTIDMIKQIYSSVCKEAIDRGSQTYKTISITVFSEFLEKITQVVKKMLTKDHNIILNKLFNNANIGIMQTGVKVSIKFQVYDDYIVEKDSGIVSIDKFKELTGISPNFESWNITQKSNKININLQGEAYLINK
tara:strand:- start:850 stop:1476 length:627 start_codon:yes stop_codon:yes gene_type:complete